MNKDNKQIHNHLQQSDYYVQKHNFQLLVPDYVIFNHTYFLSTVKIKTMFLISVLQVIKLLSKLFLCS